MGKIAIVGAGGFGKEVFSIIKSINKIQKQWDFIGFFDDNLYSQNIKENGFGKIIGNTEMLNDFREKLAVVVAVGNGEVLKKITDKINNHQVYFPNIVHPSVLFLDEETTDIGQGNIFSAHCIVSCNVKIKDFNIFNTRATLGHDVQVGSFNVFSPNVQVSGSVIIENLNFFGFNSGIIQKRKIGSQNTLAAGAMLLRHIKDNGTYMGNPAIKVEF